jgi:hypothetical protein
MQHGAEHQKPFRGPGEGGRSILVLIGHLTSRPDETERCVRRPVGWPGASTASAYTPQSPP